MKFWSYFYEYVYITDSKGIITNSLWRCFSDNVTEDSLHWIREWLGASGTKPFPDPMVTRFTMLYDIIRQWSWVNMLSKHKTKYVYHIKNQKNHKYLKKTKLKKNPKIIIAPADDVALFDPRASADTNNTCTIDIQVGQALSLWLQLNIVTRVIEKRKIPKETDAVLGHIYYENWCFRKLKKN